MRGIEQPEASASKIALLELRPYTDEFPTFMLRHGLSAANAGEATESTQSLSLTTLGHEQATRVAEEIYFIQPEQIRVSPYERAKQTLEPIQNVCPTSEVIIDTRLSEFTYLDFEGIISKRDDRKTAREAYWELCDPDYRHQHHDRHPDESSSAETFREFISRVKEVLEELHTSDKRTLIVGHEQWIMAAKWLNLKHPEEITHETMRDFREFMLQEENRVPNCGLVGVNLQEENWDGLFAPIQDYTQSVEQPLDIIELQRNIDLAKYNSLQRRFDYQYFRFFETVREAEYNERFVNQKLDETKQDGGVHKTNEVFVTSIAQYRELVAMSVKALTGNYNMSDGEIESIVNKFEDYILRHYELSKLGYTVEYGVRFLKARDATFDAILPIVKATGLVPLSVYKKTMISPDDLPPVALDDAEFVRSVRIISGSYLNEVNPVDYTFPKDMRQDVINTIVFLLNVLPDVTNMEALSDRRGHHTLAAELKTNILNPNRQIYEKYERIKSHYDFSARLASEFLPSLQLEDIRYQTRRALEQLRDDFASDGNHNLANTINAFLSVNYQAGEEDQENYFLDNNKIIVKLDYNMLDALEKSQYSDILLKETSIARFFPKTILVIPGMPDFGLPHLQIQEQYAGESGETHPEHRRFIWTQLGRVAKILHEIPGEGYGNMFDINKRRMQAETAEDFYYDLSNTLINSYRTENASKMLSRMSNTTFNAIYHYFFSHVPIIQSSGESKQYLSVHGDLTLKNCLVNPQTGELTGIIDRDQWASVDDPLAWEMRRQILGLETPQEREDYIEGFWRQGYGLSYTNIKDLFPRALIRRILDIFETIAFNSKVDTTLQTENLENDLVRSVNLYFKLVGKSENNNTLQPDSELKKTIETLAKYYQGDSHHGKHPYEEMAKFLGMI